MKIFIKNILYEDAIEYYDIHNKSINELLEYSDLHKIYIDNEMIFGKFRLYFKNDFKYVYILTDQISNKCYLIKSEKEKNIYCIICKDYFFKENDKLKIIL